MPEPIESLSLSAIGGKFRDGSLNAVALTQHCIGRHEPSLNAYREWTPEQALRQAEQADQAFANAQDGGALQGIPILSLIHI